ncbi:MAG: hydroxyacylglutathione hydrolase [Rhizobiales bacterium 65-9]|nr:hydroxyacylglutathione hydrolase [Hyphomicrobiales bacterium]OJY34789.1 MAG: hydroxyacylglutathione hydrolase [Rhizobiales bacterium 65-9]
MPAQFETFLCLSDNIGVLMHDPATGATAAIDVPDAAAALAAAGRRGWTISDILITHEHVDHVQGVAELKEKTGARVTGPMQARASAPVDSIIEDGAQVKVGDLVGEVRATPGHAAGHVIYHFPKENAAFVGDVLFVMGCGRVNGSVDEMWRSVTAVGALPDDTRLWVGHDYTLSNAKFALSVEPDNEDVQKRFMRAETMKANGELWGTTNVGMEKLTNPFLRLKQPAVRKSTQLTEAATPREVFAALREMKNRF